MELGSLAGLAQIIWLDVVLSGDNALVIGIAASTLAPGLRRKAIVFGLALATTIRILLAGAATYLLNVPGLLIAGGLALLWVSWRLFADLYWHQAEPELSEHGEGTVAAKGEGASLFKALVSITIADISMSIDNVLAVAAIARDNVSVLVFGLALSIALMGLGASLIVKILLKYRWISYVGVALLVYISVEMLRQGYLDLAGLAAA
ncbi:MAG: YjbE family putative metal transport protein [Hyphomicrobiaceae bacterium]